MKYANASTGREYDRESANMDRGGLGNEKVKGGAEVDRKGGKTKKWTERVGGRFTRRGRRGLAEERGEVMRPVTAFTPRLCGN